MVLLFYILLHINKLSSFIEKLKPQSSMNQNEGYIFSELEMIIGINDAINKNYHLLLADENIDANKHSSYTIAHINSVWNITSHSKLFIESICKAMAGALSYSDSTGEYNLSIELGKKDWRWNNDWQWN